MKWLKSFAITISVLGLIVLIGCSAVMDAVTPCFVEPEAINYTNEEPTSFMPFTTLLDAERIETKTDLIHQQKQLNLLRLIEDDDIFYSFLKDTAAVHIQGAKEFQKTVFSPEGPIGLAVPMLFGGTLGALLIPRPGDKKKEK